MIVLLLKLTYKAARVNAGLTSVEASTVLGIRPSTLSSYENGKTKPNADMLRKMANLYGCEVTDFMEVSGE